MSVLMPFNFHVYLMMIGVPVFRQDIDALVEYYPLQDESEKDRLTSMKLRSQNHAPIKAKATDVRHLLHADVPTISGVTA